jgi:dynein heavy chain, axonemal
MLWCSLESVFLGGDIAKAMPTVAKRFQKVDKDFLNIMARAQSVGAVVECCANEVLRLSLPVMFEELEKCQKSLEGYLEQKRSKFPRFFFVSNPVLLLILSQGSDPQAIQAYYEKVFDSVSFVEHDKRDRAQINEIVSREGRAEERVPLLHPIKAVGNIEEWLMDLKNEMQVTMKALAQECVMEMAVVSTSLGQLRGFVDKSCGQYALLGLQLMWTQDTEMALLAGRKDKGALRHASAKSLSILSTLSSWCLQDLGTKLNRTKIETLVTVQVSGGGGEAVTRHADPHPHPPTPGCRCTCETCWWT